MFKGVFTALVTPFRNNRIDEEALRNLIEDQIAGGVSGIVPCGTTGESATLTHDEHKKVIEISLDCAKGRIPVIAGTGSNSTVETIELTKHARDAGADAALLITPYYNKPEQEGLYMHYKAVAEAVDLPLILYNVPGRTAVNLLPQTVERLSRLGNIAGIKEATANMEQISWLKRLCGENFSLLSGDDATVLPFMSIGGHGVISVLSNVAPGDMSALVHACLEGDMDEARKLHYRLLPLANVLFSETNPIPVKAALHLTGSISDEIRLPLTSLSGEKLDELSTCLQELGLIQAATA